MINDSTPLELEHFFVIVPQTHIRRQPERDGSKFIHSTHLVIILVVVFF